MSHTYEKVSSNKAKLTFTVPAEQFDEALRQAFLKLRGRINVPGFRRGKAPRKMIETLYGESIFYDDAFEAVFPDEYSAAIDEYGLKVVDRPEVDIDEIGAGKDLKFHVEVYVRPDVTLGEYKNLAVEAELLKVDDEMINRRIAQDQDKASRTVEVEDRPVQDGDRVNLNYAGTVDGVAFDGGTADNQELTIGSNTFIPGFEEQMIGMNVGEEKDLNVTFPKEYHAEELAGKDAVFHVKVNAIEVVEKPELDDDFAADISEFSTFAEYRDSIVKELTENVEKSNRISVENAVVAKAVENAQIDVPNGMIETELDYMVQDMANNLRMQYQGLSLEDFLKYTGQDMASFRFGYKAEAERRVRNELVLEAVSKAENIEATEEDITKAVEEQAKALGQDPEKFREGLSESQLDYIKENAAIRKALDLMRDTAVVTEKKKEPAAEKTEGAEEKAEPAAEEKPEAAEETAEPAKKPARRRSARKAAETEEKAGEDAAE